MKNTGIRKICPITKSKLEEILTPIRERRKQYENNIDEVHAMLKTGTEKARSKAAEVLARVKHAMQIDYFLCICFLSLRLLEQSHFF